ncbi:MAG: HAD-IC family P-type ATPase, partial [Erysipelotrichaceae bacterium]|nr:HAD-IC family P-type ATPase [Erysipelotrichaceae bacterium]
EEVTEIGTVVYVAYNGEYRGYLVVRDQEKANAKDTIAELKSLGIRTVMLTGDKKEVGEAVGKELGIDEVYAELLPNGKVLKVEELMTLQGEKERLAFVGDGMNDAPVLARSDVGIAMGQAGSDAAIEVADMVIMKDDISKIITGRKIARKTLTIVKQNIVFALGVKGLILLLGALGYANMWYAVFADVGVSVIAILNATRALKVDEKRI